MISPVELSVDEVFARAGRSDHFRRRGIWTLLGWTVCLLLVAFVVSMLALPFLHPMDRDHNAQLADGTADPGKTDPADPSAAVALDASKSPNGNVPVGHAGSGVSKNNGGKKPDKHGKNPGAGRRSYERRFDAARPKIPEDLPPLFPWLRKDQLGGPARPWIRRRRDHRHDRRARAPRRRRIPRLRSRHRGDEAMVPCGQGRLANSATRLAGTSVAVLRQRGSISRAVGEDNVLRLSLCDCVPMAIHFWKDQAGLSLRIYNNRWALTAYATHRDGKEQVPTKYITLATDEMRNWMTSNGTYPLRMDLRFHGGEFTVSRGDMILLRVPFEGMPTETYFEGHAMFAGMDMVRASSATFPPKSIRCRC